MFILRNNSATYSCAIFVQRKWMHRMKVEMRSIIDLRESNAGSCKNSMTDWSRLKTRRFSDERIEPIDS